MTKTIRYEKVGKLDGDPVFTRHVDAEPEVKNADLDEDFEVHSRQDGRVLYKKKQKREGKLLGDPYAELM